MTLYSIDGRERDPAEAPKAGPGGSFHGFPVLGSVDVKEPRTRREIMDALRDGMARSDGTMAKCFWPRHAVRAVEGGTTTDYVICFQCLQLVEHLGDSSRTRATTRDPKRVFNARLKDAGVPLAPGAEGDDP